MKKYKYLLTSLLLIGLSSCDIEIILPSSEASNSDISNEDYDSSTFISSDELTESSTYEDISSEQTSSEEISSEQTSSEQTSSEEISSEETSSEEQEPNYDIIPTNFYTLDSNGITEMFYQGESFEINTWNNYLVLDDKGRIVYTVANAGCGYGMPIDEFYYSHPLYQESIIDYVKDGYFIIPESCMGYSISYEAYGNFANMVSNGIISVKEFEDNGYGEAIKNWNSLNNDYFDVYTGIKISTTTTEKLTVKNAEVFRLSSLYDNTDSKGLATYFMYAPYTDKYTITCKNATNIEVYNSSKVSISKGTTSVTVNLSKDENVYVKVTSKASSFFNLEVSLETNNVELPYEVNSSIDMRKLSTNSSSSSSPMKAAELKYTKRSDDRGLYVNSNNP